MDSSEASQSFIVGHVMEKNNNINAADYDLTFNSGLPLKSFECVTFMFIS